MNVARTAVLAATIAAGAFAAGPTSAQTTLTPGNSAIFELAGSVSLYQVFGHAGSTVGAATDAPWFSFGAGSDNVFTFSGVIGGLNCCGDGNALATPDGGTWLGDGSSQIEGINGISSAFGNTQLPLVAMFGSGTDPFGSPAPAALPAWDAQNPLSLAPALYQVFYVGDGRAGVNNPAGALLSFTAPTNATRLYVGFVDAGNFVGLSAWYHDNPGLVAGLVTLAVPEPASVGLMAVGLLALYAARRRQQRLAAPFVAR